MAEAVSPEAIRELRVALAGFHGTKTWGEIVGPRDEVLARFRPLFSAEGIPSLTAEEFRPFLYFEHNRHWTQLYRRGLGMCSDMPALRQGLMTLADERQPVAARVDKAIGMVDGMGKAIATAILLVMQPDLYGVWNTTSESGLRRTGTWPRFGWGSSLGQKYECVNGVLCELRDAVEIDLWTLDGLWWHYNEGKPSLPHSWPRPQRQRTEDSRTSPDKAQYVLDIDRAGTAVRTYNSSTSLLASETLLDRCFGNLRDLLNPDAVAQRVVLLDGLWQTRLYMEAGAADRIIANLAQQASRLTDLLDGLSDDALEDNPERVIEAAHEALPAILEQEPGEAGQQHRQNYSFATKFLHWCTRIHFPIADSRARKRINQIQRSAGASPRIRSSTAAMMGLSYVDEYDRWIGFYSDLIRCLPEPDREELLRVDHDSQPTGQRVTNSLLRVLDKVFYVQGGGSGVGRISAT